MKTKRRMACICLTAVMAASFTAGNALALTNINGEEKAVPSVLYDKVEFENVSDKLDLTGIALQNLSPAVMDNPAGSTEVSASGTRKTVIVNLNSDCVMDSVPEGESASDYLATYSGGKALKKIIESQNGFLNELSAIGADYEVVYKYSTVANAVALRIDTGYISEIEGMDSVGSVFVSQTHSYPKTATSDGNGATTNPNEVYATGIYNSENYISEYGGKGMTVAILDTGLDYTHEAFTKYMPPAGTLGLTKEQLTQKLALGSADDTKIFKAVELSASNGKNITADDLYVSDKVPFAYDYADKDADVYPSYSQHGTHVAGIVAGHADSYSDKDGNKVEEEFIGVAPDAQLVICKVFTDDFESKDIGGATSESIMAALEDCALLGVDVINMSLGTVSGFSSVSLDEHGNPVDSAYNSEAAKEDVQLSAVYNKLKSAGISLICAASNEYSSGFGSAFGTNLKTNPDSGTVGSPSTFAGALSVASINGQRSRYMIANGKSIIFYQDASDENSVRYDFTSKLLGSKKSETFKYVVVRGTGQRSDYTTSIRNNLNDPDYRTIAVISRGSNSFQDKVQIAQSFGADAVIIYNNVSGTVGMSLGDLEDPVPSVSVTMDAGALLTRNENNTAISTGFIEINADYQAGPFMNDYSSWGTTPDLKIKPEVTSHGGEITSTVAGGYAEMSGTSMASPNLAGFVALLRGKLKNAYSSLTPQELTRLVNQIIMSTAVTVYDQTGLPYSPRKQGAGLATLDNAFSTNAYLYTVESEGGAEDNRPKVELGDDKAKTGKYTLKFYVKNTGTAAIQFKSDTIFMTETLASDGLSVAEKAHLFGDNPAEWTVNGSPLAAGASFTVNGGDFAEIVVKLSLSEPEKKYLANFTNGMFVEGFLKLISATQGQCDLTLPFMGFYGDWEAAPMLDYDCYQIADSEKDTSVKEEDKLQPRVWATQAFASYYNDKYSIPMGGYVYVQDENAQQIYTDREHAAVSCYNVFYGEDALNNYMTASQIKALYAGLLRNAEVVTYTVYDAATGEVILEDAEYTVGKAYANGGSSVPSQVLLELDPLELGLQSNGKYQIDFNFYFKTADMNNPDKQDKGNTFSMVFYADYEAPVLADSRIRYYDYKDGNKDKRRVYLDLDVYDNHYAQSAILCYTEKEEIESAAELKMVTDYVTPVYNAVKNGTTTISIEITDVFDKIKNGMYVQLDDYALNHSVYRIVFATANGAKLPDSFELSSGTSVTLGVNQTYKVALSYDGDASHSNFTWTAVPQNIVKVNNGEIFGVAPGRGFVTVTAGKISKTITVNVVESSTVLQLPSLSFKDIENSGESLQQAVGDVKVNAGQTFKLGLTSENWYYPVENLEINWSSSNERIATVTSEGVVSTLNEKGDATIRAVPVVNGVEQPLKAAVVRLLVQEPFTVSNFTLTRYHGSAKTVKIPDDKNIMTIGEEAFKDNTTAEVIIIPKTVTEIDERAFINCSALKEIYFVDTEKLTVPESALSLIMARAFENCTALEKIDLSNVKVISLARKAFYGCTNLKTIVNMQTIGSMYDSAFEGCTSLTNIDITGLHISGADVFKDCTKISGVETGYFTAIGDRMFYGCISLGSIIINNTSVGANAFEKCSSLSSVTFGAELNGQPAYVSVGDMAFKGCASLSTVTFNCNVARLGDMAFNGCGFTSVTIPDCDTVFGDRVFDPSVTVNVAGTAGGYEKDSYGVLYRGTTLVLAPGNLASGFTVKSDTTAIAPYAFSGCTFGNTQISLPATVTEIGEGAFANSNITKITLPSSVDGLSAYIFSGSKLSEIEIPATITEIGEGAFAECNKLATVTFAASSGLEKLGDGAFFGCVLLEAVALPAGASVMGSLTFSGCTALTTVTLPSVTSIGAYTFEKCENLETVVFGANATVTGNYTFFPGTYLTEDKEIKANKSSLKSVTLGNSTYELGEGLFYYCTALESIDLKNVTVINSGAFANCTNLATVTNLSKVEYIGEAAFSLCSSLTALNLEKAEYIGAEAFFMDTETPYTTLGIPAVREIGSLAFAGGGESAVNLPATLKSVGAGAFANSKNLTEITVDGSNAKFFSEGGVLYRIVSGTREKGTYELCAYPSAKVAANKTYTAIDGTVTVQAYAFAFLKENSVKKVVIPYSVKTLGDGAFYLSGITEYEFKCINAPTLLTETYDLGKSFGENFAGFYSLFYTNFGEEFLIYSSLIVPQVTSPYTLSYPKNGIGYDNYVFKNYFGSKVASEHELLDDTTRRLIEMIEGFVSPETVKSWNSLEVNAANKEAVEEFSESVKEAHRILNTIVSAEQLAFLGDENVRKLSDIERELKPVKVRFDIPFKVESLTIDPTCSYKKDYAKGEKFDISGLKLIITYDDFSTENADMSKISIADGYDGPLSALDIYVLVEGYGKQLRVPVTVTEGNGGSQGGTSGGKVNPAVIYGPIIGVVAAAGIAVACVFIIRKFKNKKKGTEVPDEENQEKGTEVSDEENKKKGTEVPEEDNREE